MEGMNPPGTGDGKGKPHHHPRSSFGNVDGFVPNHRNRTLNEPFQKKPSSGQLTNPFQPRGHSAESSARVALNPMVKDKSIAGVAWTPRIQDPSSIELSRKTGRKSHRAKKEDIKQARNWKRIAKRGSLVVLTLFILVGGFLGFKFFHNIDKIFGGNIFSNIGDLFSNTTLKGESTGRINILLAGDSADDPNHQGADLTDSILLLSINTKTHSAFLLSIPRDLWVMMPNGTWPGGTYQKINAANEITNFSAPGYPNGGMGALSYVVQQDLGIPVDYYGVMDYGAFQDSVNAVGGVKVNIQSPDPRGLYDPNVKLKLPNGWVSLNGAEALNLARARGDGYGSYGFPNSDFDRTEHQRQLFIAVAQKAETLGVISNPDKVSNLFDALGNNFQTNLNLSDVLALVHLTKGINPNNIQSYSFCSTLSVGLNGCTTPILTSYTDPGSGQEAQSPVLGVGNYSQMVEYYEKITSNNPIVKEGASVAILNGGNTVGLAKQYQTSLISKGYNVVSIADAVTDYPKTEIMDNSGGADPNTRAGLVKIFGNNVVPNVSTVNTTGAKFVVILGVPQGPPS